MIITVVVAAACGDEKIEKRPYPVVNTYAVSDLNEQGVTLNGEILDIGDGVKEYGFFYGPISISDDAGVYNDRLVLGTVESPGKFSAIANRNMIKDREYYYRAYAVAKTNSVLVLGQELKFVSKGSTPPVVKDFYPKTGTVGDEVVIVGSNFSSSEYGNYVRFGSITATITSIRKDTLIARVPNSTPIDGVPVSVEVGQLKSESTEKFNVLPVTFSSYEPGIAGFGDTVIVKGKNFPLYLEGAQITMLNTLSHPLASTRTEMKFVVSGFVKVIKSTVKVTVGLQNKTFDNEIKLTPPTVTGFDPMKAWKDVIVTITGEYFSVDKTSNVVTLAGKTLEIVEAAPKLLKVKIPAGVTPGKYPFNVKVVGQAVTSTGQIEIIKPEIESIAPLTGTWGTEVTIKGKNFGLLPEDNIVIFNTTTATITSASATEIKAIVPNTVTTLTATVTVQVKTLENNKETFATPFTFDAPEITSFTPNEEKSNSVITLTGKNFHPTTVGNSVWFGDEATGLQGQVMSSNGTSLSVKLPPQAINLKDTLINIVVKAGTRYITAANKFHFISAWKRVADFPAAARMDATAFSIGNYGYVGLGNETGTAKRFWRYDQAGNTWNEIAEFTSVAPVSTTTAFTDIGGFSMSSNGFVGVGNFSTGNWGSLAKYDPSLNQWTSVSPLTDRVSRTAGGAINGKIYIAGGALSSGQLSSNLWEYDTQTNTWLKKTNMPSPGRQQASSFVINSRLYVVFGLNCASCGGGGSWTRDLYEYDADNDTWRTRATFPDTRLNSASFGINGKGYVLGGVTSGGTQLSSFHMYDPAVNQWKEYPTFPGGALEGAVTFTINNKVYVGTGRTTGNKLRNAFWEFDPSKL